MISGPVLTAVHAVELGLRLRAHRNALGLTTAIAGKATGIGGTNLSSIEIAKRRLTPAGLARLVEHYELPPGEVAELEALRIESERRQWWDDYTRIYGDEMIRFLALEAGASHLREYAPETIPGLLQTADYARAMIQGGSPYIRPVDVGPRVESRLARQTRLDGPDPVRYSVVLGQTALRQEVGGRAVMRRQLDQLVEAIEAKRDQVDVRVMSYGAGAHPLIGGAVKIMQFGSSWVPDFVWLESVATTGGLIDRRETVLELTASFEDVFERALDREASLAMIHQIRKEMENR